MPLNSLGKIRYLAAAKIVLLVLAGFMIIGSGGCKSKKKLAMELAAKEYAEKVENAKGELRAILNDDGTMPLTEKERRLLNIRDQNLNDPEVNDLITQVEAKIIAEKKEIEKKKREEEERKKKEEEEQLQNEKDTYQYVEDYFYQIAFSKNYKDANEKIEEALKLFVDDQVPVLTVISEENGQPDYDKPTTIVKYLHYLKDQKSFDKKVYQVKTDDYGLIIEVELINK
ncbi:MAG: hypothetical protein K8R53_10620 [Bacteroidales bacterium]|nr:hypothetical protein [Bacteroidales bacterium]